MPNRTHSCSTAPPDFNLKFIFRCPTDVGLRNIRRTSKSPTRSDIAVSNAIHILIDAGSCNRSSSVGFFVFFFVDLRIRSYISRAYLNVKPFRTSNKQIKHVKRLWEYVAIIGVLTVKRYIFYGSVRKSNHGV